MNLRRRANSYDNVSRLIEDYRFQLKSLDRNSTDQSLKINLDKLYQVLHSGISILSKKDDVTNLASLQSNSKKRKLTKDEQQLRFKKYSDSQAGRPPMLKMKKPDTPQKKVIYDILQTPTKRKTEPVVVNGSNQRVTRSKKGKGPKKLNFTSVGKETKINIVPRRKRGRSPKLSLNTLNQTKK